MTTVTLCRHAKSGQKNDPKIDDFDRTLSSRGLKNTPTMGMAMRDLELRPNLVLCSPSVRTRQTYALAAAPAWDYPPPGFASTNASSFGKCRRMLPML
jgi:phosphohistidine phosphatase